MTAGLFVQLFRRTFGFDEKHLPLFVFMAGSPFFLKNFMHTLGHFDIYGCLLAICLLLIPARSLGYVLLAAMFSIVLVLIHHIHLLMYVPTIAAIVVLRHYLVHGADRQNVAVGIAALAAIGVLFIAAQFYGTMTVPETEFVAYLQGRMADPSQTNLLSFAYIWYQPLSKEICGHLGAPAAQPSRRAGVCAADLAAHAALAIFSRSDRGACHRNAPPHRHRCDHHGQPRLSRHVRDRVRLFALDFELGGVPVPDPACGEDAAGFEGHAADIRRMTERPRSSAGSSR